MKNEEDNNLKVNNSNVNNKINDEDETMKGIEEEKNN